MSKIKFSKLQNVCKWYKKEITVNVFNEYEVVFGDLCVNQNENSFFCKQKYCPLLKEN